MSVIGNLVERMPGGRFLVEHEPPELDPRTILDNIANHNLMNLGNVVGLSFGWDVAHQIEQSVGEAPLSSEQTQANLGGVAAGAEYAPTDPSAQSEHLTGPDGVSELGGSVATNATTDFSIVDPQPLSENAVEAYLDKLAA